MQLVNHRRSSTLGDAVIVSNQILNTNQPDSNMLASLLAGGWDREGNPDELFCKYSL